MARSKRSKKNAAKKKAAKKTAIKKKTPKKQATKKRAAPKKAKKKAKKAVATRPTPKSVTRPRASLLDDHDERSLGRRHRGIAGGQSGDTQGLSRLEDVDSESVKELIEEGQGFEAGIVAGVEEAGRETGEVRTRQVLEDDVPPEYLDKD